MFFGAWLMYVGTPLYNMIVLDDDKNLDKKYEKKFLQSKLFLIPLYAYVLGMLITHIWCMALFSTGPYKFDHWMFDHKPEGVLQYLVFGFVISFFGSLSSLAGHELVHHKEWYNKLVGNIPYTQAFYSHFWDEHTRGHHKDIATPLDPVCHDTGVDCYTGMFKAVVGTHTKTWARENQRLQAHYGTKDISSFTILTENRMVHYFVLHCCMVWAIYEAFGMGGVKF
jgi:hypothetical protein